VLKNENLHKKSDEFSRKYPVSLDIDSGRQTEKITDKSTNERKVRYRLVVDRRRVFPHSTIMERTFPTAASGTMMHRAATLTLMAIWYSGRSW
jgi:hypothetical protein